MYNTWHQTLASLGGAGTALANSTTATSLTTGAAAVPARYQLPVNLLKVNDYLIVHASGQISSTATPTLSFQFNAGSTAIFSGGASAAISGVTNLTWQLFMKMQVTAIGSSATVKGTGYVLGLTSGSSVQLLPATAPANGTAFDITTSPVLDLFATWSAASASNTITLHNYVLIHAT